tara:strand:+ start:792 stop:1691 length:900 start_codon:yes stop_codon:yes gene_type:complete
MHNIIIPKSNSNDTEVFIAEWKFNSNDLVKKGDHLFSVETSKVVEEIFAKESGYLRVDIQEGERVKVGDTVGFISDNKNDLKKETQKKQDNNLIFTKKAEKLILENNLDKKYFKTNKIVNEEVVKDYLKNNKEKNNSLKPNQLIILIKNEKPYHACVYFSSHGIIDLSLLGSKIHNLSDYNFNECKCAFFNLDTCNKEKAIKFFSQPALLTDKIIKKEKSSRGWSQKAESADFILNFRNKRSININDMNCIEWLVRGLEISGIQIPENILTATSLLNWASKNLKFIKKEENQENFKPLY